jgi:hypothetical protein
MNEVDELLLEHFGKKGMHWGVRSNPANRSMNKAARAKNMAKFKSSVETARANVAPGGKSSIALQKAKNAHAANKAKLGTFEARRILNEAKNKHYQEVRLAQQAKDGKEVTKVLLTSAAAGVAVFAISRALSKSAF